MTGGGREHPARSWRRALGLAALTLWLPTLLPFGFGPLRECTHCVGTYAACLPIVPGVLVPVLANADGAWFFALAGAVALLAFGGLGVVLRELPRPWANAAQGAVVLAVAAEALGFAYLLRM